MKNMSIVHHRIGDGSTVPWSTFLNVTASLKPRVMTKLTNLMRFLIAAIRYFSCHSMPQNRTDNGATDTINCVALCQSRLHKDTQNPKNI